ncbi:NAD(P)H-binding protein [Nakamurella sp. A5-74]|uniref:NAD(P)H-binding protein n=1 Tax=Nakamurella sp. A5-74 TaxID=3158264 RepID=A0AAU8DVS2_9ACTN
MGLSRVLAGAEPRCGGRVLLRPEKKADVALSRSGLDWVILRPSLLVDGPPAGTVSLGPAELHSQITRDDVAQTLLGLLHEPRIGRQILELTTGSTPIQESIRANVR